MACSLRVNTSAVKTSWHWAVERTQNMAALMEQIGGTCSDVPGTTRVKKEFLSSYFMRTSLTHLKVLHMDGKQILRFLASNMSLPISV